MFNLVKFSFFIRLSAQLEIAWIIFFLFEKNNHLPFHLCSLCAELFALEIESRQR